MAVRTKSETVPASLVEIALINLSNWFEVILIRRCLSFLIIYYKYAVFNKRYYTTVVGVDFYIPIKR